MDEPTVLETFEDYRVDFDRLFKEREHKFQTSSYMSIDHCHIMDILSNSIREKMIKKLGEVYSKKGVSTPSNQYKFKISRLDIFHFVAPLLAGYKRPVAAMDNPFVHGQV